MGITQQINTLDTDTGEIFLRKSVMYSDWDDEKGHLFRCRNGAVRTFTDVPLPSCLSKADKGRIYDFSRATLLNTNMLFVRTSSGVRPMYADEIGDIVELKDRQLRSFLKSMIDLRVLAKVMLELPEGGVETQYYLNPIYFHHGKYINLNLYLFFRHDIDLLISDRIKMRFGELVQRSTDQ